MGSCDICNRTLDDREGFLLTTEQVVSTPAYWRKVLSHGLFAAFGPPDDSKKAALANMMASQVNPWVVCDDCIDLFSTDRDRARRYAIRWYESGGSFAPPGSGAAALAKVNMGDGKLFLRGGSPEALELGGLLASAPKQSNSSCFIATAAFSASSPEVNILRRFRDEMLMKHSGGRRFVDVYYRIAPIVARWTAASSLRRRMIRGVLFPVVCIAEMCLDRTVVREGPEEELRIRTTASW